MIKDEYRTETNKDVYAESNGKRGLEEHSTGDYSNDYVKWLETKLKNNEVLDLVSKCDCPHLVACEICGEEKGLDGDFWKNKKKHDC